MLRISAAKARLSRSAFPCTLARVLGFSGLMGAGRTEIMRCIFGLDRPDSGAIYLGGKKLEIRCPLDAIKAGIAMVSEDRRREGIIPHMTVRENTTLAALPWISRFGWIDAKKDLSITEEYIDSLNVKTPSTEQLIMNLSGRQPTEGLPCKMAQPQSKGRHSRRADARHRRRREGGDSSPD